MVELLTQLTELDVVPAALAVVGLFVLTNNFLNALGGIYKTCIRGGKDLKKFGKWAVVTGATDGIGKAYAFALVKKGLSVVLISRTESKLVEVKKELDALAKEGVEVKYVVCDFSNFDAAARAKVKAAISGLDVGVLINNVGVSYRYPRFFHELTEEEVAGLMEMNVNSTTWMTFLVLPQMLERKQGGAIVNLSSGSAMYTLPLLAEYSAAKSYIEKFSRALHSEYYSTHKVSTQCQIPFYVSTKLAKMRQSLSVPTPEAYVKTAMKFVGQNDCVVSPFYIHALMSWMMNRLLPASLVTWQIKAMHLATRKRGMKKDAAKAAEAAGKKTE